MKKFECNLLSVLACPICKGKLVLYSTQTDNAELKQELVCRFDKVAYSIHNGTPMLLSNKTRPLTLDELEKVPKL